MVTLMETEFCREYIAIFHRWKEEIELPKGSKNLLRLFIGFVNLQFCIENKWIDVEINAKEKSFFDSFLESIFSSESVVSSNFFSVLKDDIRTIPDTLVEELFSANGLFSKYRFCSDESTLHESHVTPSVLSTLFEKLVEQRQALGTFYTPKTVVQFMAKHSFEKLFNLNSSEDQLLSTKVIDPACGSGALLLGCAEELENRVKSTASNLSTLDLRIHIVQNCLYGVDIDQDALDIAYNRLWFWMNLGQENPFRITEHKLRKGNSVTGSNPQHNSVSIGFEYRDEFPDVFLDNSSGFDIVIANPPYVRQELIDKKIKNHVLKHRIFGQNVSGMSDLYVYFLARTGQLLRSGGVSSIVCSNTWMDAQYGRPLQLEFLLHYVEVEILGWQKERQFDSAEINTVFMFMKKGSDGSRDVRFSLLKGALTSSLESVDNCSVRKFSSQSLIERGMKNSEYTGTKWSILLHAPEMFLQLMENQPDKFITIEELCQRTLRNNLRVLPQGYTFGKRVPSEYSMPYVKSFKDIKTLQLQPSNHPSVSHRDLYSVFLKPTFCRPDFVANRFFSSRIAFIEGGDFFVSDSFFLGKLKSQYNSREVILSLNSTLSLWFVELGGRKGLGGGLLSFYGPEFRTHCLLMPSYFRTLTNQFYDQFVEREFGDVFDECGFDIERALLPSSDERYLSIRSQMPNPLPDRKTIDQIVFDALEFNDSQLNEVYWSLCESVLTRLKKADSV